MDTLAGGTTAREAAGARLDDLAARLDRLGADDFRQMAFPSSGARDRSTPRRTAEAAVAVAGLSSLLDDARTRVRDHMDRVYVAAGYQPTWATLNWGLSTGPVADRVAATSVVEDAALAAVADGIAPDDVVAALRGPFDLVAEAHPPRPGGSVLPTARDVRGRGPLFVAATGVVVLIVVLFAVAAGLEGGVLPVAIVLASVAIIGWVAARGARRDAD